MNYKAKNLEIDLGADTPVSRKIKSDCKSIGY